ncbi:MAG: S8 family serine peptidase [Gemmatimonadetes bacterium]|nr:S8 family serine peptidase [Gemmatimonadota bacterium]
MKQVRYLPLALLVGASLAACVDETPTAVPTAPTPVASFTRSDGEVQEFVAGRVIVRFTPGTDDDEVTTKHGAKKNRKMHLDRTWVLDVPEGKELETAADLSQTPGVEFAEPDYMYAVSPCEVGSCETPTDPFLGYKWDLSNNGSIRNGSGTVLGATGKVDADIDWAEAFDYLGPNFGGSAVIGIIDTGIYSGHADLAGRVIAARNFATGYASDFTVDRDGHGTHVAGIAAGRGNNGLGISGVAYGANIKLISAKACEKYRFADGSIATSCPTSSTADAIVWAVDQGANVLNLSLGGAPNATSGSAAQQAALQYARSKNVLPFCSTGNDNFNGISFPARFPECVAVGATDWSDKRASYSNYGPQIAFVAPGGDSNPLKTAYSLILSADTATRITQYVWKAGTSMATPQATGLAALLYATGMTNTTQILERMKQTADDLGPAGWDPEYGAGRLNVYRAITGQDPNAPPIATEDGPYSGIEGGTVSFDGSASRDPNGKPITYAWSFGDGATATGAKVSHVYADNGSYTVTLKVTDQSGLSTTVASQATIANANPTVTLGLSAATVPSGGSVALTGSFDDAGVNDAPWAYTIDWGNGTSTGTTTDRSASIAGTRQFCAAGSYTVRLSVRDKDGGSGSDASGLTVTRNGISITAPASVNSKAQGTFPVTVLTDGGFDAARVDVSKVTLGDGNGAETPVAKRNNGTYQASMEDVDHDGDLDLVLHFDRAQLSQNANLTSATTQVVLLADLKDGCTQVRATAPVKVVP